MQINGSSAIVTGGASGLGEAAARTLATEGVRVTIFDRNEERAKEVAGEIGDQANFVGGDVTNPDDCQRAVEAEGRRVQRDEDREDREEQPGHHGDAHSLFRDQLAFSPRVNIRRSYLYEGSQRLLKSHCNCFLEAI